ncbi:class I SAM-dependent methyltransferase [Dictyobacter kobayashii]|uniref:Methyltransferase n=1 Tax=Dictyobacter kobayashii TaxID=2014872 RepID=A0A402AM46_9CHLR|nr:class I SAM-dependent methyltransferase [Dictyobacter kobayashii]GCE20241.1 methyltransferase [Dictyobacter kobayashii]
MSSLSFDAIAHLYDQTRGYPDDVASQVAQAISKKAHARAHTTFLEVGVGTGRIALPIASLGCNYTGVDISEKMLARLHEKARADGWLEKKQAWGSRADEIAQRAVSVRRFHRPGSTSTLRLVSSDIKNLPFHDSVFDIVVAVHIFHLVDGWEKAVEEVVRVIKPGGRLLHCWDTYEHSATQSITNKWRQIVRELGGKTQSPGASIPVVKQWFQQHGFQTIDEQAYIWRQPMVPRVTLDFVAKRYWSSTWSVDDDIFSASIERLQTWAQEYYGDLDKEYMQERHFMISTTFV